MKGKRQILDLFNKLALGPEWLAEPSTERLVDLGTPVFMLGAPRCGSTLSYQALVTRFHFSYVTNMMNTLYAAPSLAHLLTPATYSGIDHNGFSSRWGKVEGRAAPSEGGRFWAQWFPRRRIWPWHSPFAPPRRDAAQLPMEIARISALQGGPFLSKNLFHSLRIMELTRAFPQAVFIVVTRPVPDIAASLLEAREQIYGNTGRWFSVLPENSDDLLDLPPSEQVVGQVVRLYRNIERDLVQSGNDRWIELPYERFCAAPEAEATRIAEQLNEFGLELEAFRNLPISFEVRSKLNNRPERDEILAATERWVKRVRDGQIGQGRFLRKDSFCDA